MWIEVPDKIQELIPVVSVSGGKDSTAACLALTEAGIEHRRVFADTGRWGVTWQHWARWIGFVLVAAHEPRTHRRSFRDRWHRDMRGRWV